MALGHVVEARPPHHEAPDGDRGAVERERRDDDVDPRSIGEARVDHGARLVDAPPDAPGDALRDVHQVLGIAEADVHRLQSPAAFDICGAGAVDQDVGDALVLQQGLDRTESLDVVHELRDHPLAVERTQLRGVGLARLEEGEELGGERFVVQIGDP